MDKSSHHQKTPPGSANKPKLEADDQPTPVLNSEGKIVYSKFDFAAKNQEDKGKNLAGKDYKKLLNAVVKRNEKLNDLKGKSPEKAAKLESKLHWQAALKRAGGEKVKVSLGNTLHQQDFAIYYLACLTNIACYLTLAQLWLRITARDLYLPSG